MIGCIHDNIGPSYCLQRLKASIPTEMINDFQYEFDIDLPRSLIVFWLWTNGFSGLIGHFDVVIWPIDEVKRRHASIARSGKNMTFQIGSILGRPISLVYRDGIGYFEWFSYDGTHKVSNYTSFFDLIDDLHRMLSVR